MIVRAQEGRKTETPHARKGKGTTYSRLLVGERKGSALRALAVHRLPPGAGWGPKTHPDLDEFYYILSGKAEVRDEEKIEPLEADDFALVRAKDWSAIKNAGSEDLVFLSGLVSATRNVLDLKEFFG
jgi:mannose-6-phosphate isomerase-like protein (cupin superfamily)